MKTPISFCLALLAIAPASAQVFRPETVNGAVLGGIAGAVIGNNSGSLNHNAWKGAAIGAVAGGLIGSAVADTNDRRDTQVRAPRYDSPYVYRSAPVVYRDHRPGVIYGGYGGSAARDGLVFGALAGGIIGHNSGSFRHNGWRGAAWGAGAGWLLGSIVDSNRYYGGYSYGYDYPRRSVVVERPVYVQESAPQPAAAPAAAPQQVTIINNYYGNATPMSQANGLFGR
jgi:uncharacterized protein YcfJ